jgi:cobalt/nickel transport system ATP-binding protein
VTAAALQVQGLCFSYPDGTAALRGVDLRIGPGEAVALVGANGAGKSTLLQQFIGLLLPSAGQVWVGDLAVTQATLAAVRRRVGYVFQDADDQLFMPTVQEDVAFGPNNLKLPEAEVQQRVEAALGQVGALHLAQRPPWRLSGGEKRAVAIAGVLAMQPEVLLLDEPSAGLDPGARRRLIGLLGSCPQTRVVATHDLDLVLDACSRVLVLHQGRLAADGRPDAVFADATLLAKCQLEAPLQWSGRHGI